MSDESQRAVDAARRANVSPQELVDHATGLRQAIPAPTSDERVQRYAEALINADPDRTGPLVVTQFDAEQASAAMEVADAEQSEWHDKWTRQYATILRERDELRRKVAGDE